MKYLKSRILFIAAVLVFVGVTPALAGDWRAPFTHSMVWVTPGTNAYASVNVATGYMYARIPYPPTGAEEAYALIGGPDMPGAPGMRATITFNGILNAAIIVHGYWPNWASVVVDLMIMEPNSGTPYVWKQVYGVSIYGGQTEVDHGFAMGECSLSYTFQHYCSWYGAVRLHILTTCNGNYVTQGVQNSDPAYLYVGAIRY